MHLFVAGMSYKTAPVQLRERLAAHPSSLRCCGCRLKIGADLSEVVLLSTSNRVEVYGVTPCVNGNIHNIFRHLTSRAAALMARLIPPPVRQSAISARIGFTSFQPIVIAA